MDETVRLTYTELATARGITLQAARRLALRHKWRKQLGNDGLTHVWVPLSALPRDGMPDPTSDPAPDTAPERVPDTVTLSETSLAAIANLTRDAMSDLKSVVTTLQDAIISLRVELFAERDRADRAEKENHQLRAQLARRWWRRS